MRTIEEPMGRRPQIWAVGGGKGGTGKSLVAVSLAIHLAGSGRRVVLVDGDLGAPNLHTFLGLDPPPVALGDFIKGKAPSLDAVAVETGVPRLRLISGARNCLDLESLKHFQKTRLVRFLLGLSSDVVVVDLGAGTSLNVLDLFSIADRGVMAILPEPTSVENCYRFLRAAYLRRLQTLGQSLGYQPVVNLVLEHRGRYTVPRPEEVLEEIRRIDSCAAATLGAQLRSFLPRLVINQARDARDAGLGSLIETVARRFVGIPVAAAGSIPYDPVLVRSVKSRRPFLIEYSRSSTARAFRAVAEAIITPCPEREQGPVDPYSILDLHAGATHEDVLAAYMRLRPALRSDSPALISLDCEAERLSALAEVESAYRILSRNLSVPGRPPQRALEL